MSFDDLPAKIQEIVVTAYTQGLKQFEQVGSSDLTDQEEPRLEQLCFVEIPQLFQPFLGTPDPASFTPLIECMRAAMAVLSTGDNTADPLSKSGGPYLANVNLEMMPGCLNLLDAWTGRAAHEFVETFIKPFPSLVRNQFVLVSAVKSGLEAEQAIWQQVRSDVVDVADKTLSAFEAMLHNSCNSRAFTVTLAVVAAIATVATEIPTLGASTAITLAVVGATSSVVGAAAPLGNPVNTKIRGGEPAEIVASLRECLELEYQLVRDTDQRVSTALVKLINAVVERADSFVSPPPRLASADAASVTGSDFLGYPPH